MAKPLQRKSTKMGRVYEVDDLTLPSVTTVLRQMAAPALERWKMKQVAIAAVEGQDWRAQDPETAVDLILVAGTGFGKRAAATGTEVHALIEAVEDGTLEITDVPAYAYPYMRAAQAVLGTLIHIGETVALERAVMHHPGPDGFGGYAGTADLFYQAEGGLGVLDWKSKADPGSTAGWSNDALQLAALSRCDTWVSADGELHPMEDEVVELTIAAVKADGTADWRTISAPDTISQLVAAFDGLLAVHELMAANPWWMGIWDESGEGITI